jgi:hypothetical protein
VVGTGREMSIGRFSGARYAISQYAETRETGITGSCTCIIGIITPGWAKRDAGRETRTRAVLHLT